MLSRIAISTLSFFLIGSLFFHAISYDTIERQKTEMEFDSNRYSKIVSMLHERINSLE
jgi:hypothetical protein